MADDDDIVRDVLRELDEFYKGTGEIAQKPVEIINKSKQIVRQAADKLEEKYGENIPEDEIVKEAHKKGVDEEDARTLINDLVSDGYLQRPEHMSGIVRLHGRTEFQRWAQEFVG